MANEQTKQHCPVMATSSGRPIGDNQNSVTAGPHGPVLMEDYLLLQKMAQFNCERIPEYVEHAKRAAAYGMFTATHDFTQFTSAKLLNTNSSESRRR
jgi:catalase